MFGTLMYTSRLGEPPVSKPFMWIPDKSWLNVIALSDAVKTFKTVPDLIQRNDQMWRYWWDQEVCKYLWCLWPPMVPKSGVTF